MTPKHSTPCSVSLLNYFLASGIYTGMMYSRVLFESGFENLLTVVTTNCFVSVMDKVRVSIPKRVETVHLFIKVVVE